MNCTCGIADDFIGAPHEHGCGIDACCACGEIGGHTMARCPEFAIVRCCGAVTMCFGCPLQAVSA